MKTFFYGADPVVFDSDPYFDAFTVENGVIRETGPRKELEFLLKPGFKRVNLGGKCITPGLTDCHLHLLAYAATKEKNVSLKGLASLGEVQNKVTVFIEKTELLPGSWVCGSGWNHDAFPGRRMPDRHDLDVISANHPIKLLRMCYHICVVSSRALELAGITKDTPDPPGGRIDRDSEGHPTGVLRESAMTLVDKVIPAIMDKEEMKELILSACEDLVSVGFTAVHTDDFGFVGDRKALLDAYRELDESGLLPLDVVLQMIIYEPGDFSFYVQNGLKTGTRFNRLVAGPVKILGDGSLGSRTAALKEPYSDDPGTCGFMLMPEETMDQMIHDVFKKGFDVAVHAIGDLTMETVAGLFRKYQSLIGKHRLNPSIIHCSIASDEALQTIKDCGIIANIQPIFLHSDWPVAGERVGSNRLKTSYCWKTYRNRGIQCVGSSDAPVESYNPFWNMYTAVSRKDLNDQPEKGWIPEEALSREEALKLFTVLPPLLTGETGHKGRLKAGYCADFAVLSGHPYTGSNLDLKNLSVLATCKGGKKVYQAPGAEPFIEDW